MYRAPNNAMTKKMAKRKSSMGMGSKKKSSIDSQNRLIVKPCVEAKLQEMDFMREKLDQNMQVNGSPDFDEIHMTRPAMT